MNCQILQNILGITWIVSTICYWILNYQNNKSRKFYLSKLDEIDRQLKKIEEIKVIYEDKISQLENRERIFYDKS